MNTGMIFAIIFAVIVIGFIFVFASGQIANIFCLGNDAQTSKILKDLEFVTGEVYNLAEGSSKIFKLNLPSDSKICFIDPENTGTQVYGTSEQWKIWDPDPVIKSMIEEKGYNVWYQHCSGQDGYKISHLLPDKNFCAKSASKLYLENKGLFVEVSV